MTDAGQLTPQQIWIIAPSPHQPPATQFELTHNRSMTLPFAIDFVMNGKKHSCLYAGRGQSKTVFRLLDEPKVLKLTLTVDHEPYASRLLAMRCSAEQPGDAIQAFLDDWAGHCHKEEYLRAVADSTPVATEGYERLSQQIWKAKQKITLKKVIFFKL